MENYIFTGIGHSAGKYKSNNTELEKHLKSGALQGFAEERFQDNEEFIEFKKTNPHISAFEFFVEHKMGFKQRCSVVNYPPTKEKIAEAESAVDLGVKAIDMALKNAKINPENIDAWIVGCATPHQQAPGIAGTIKAHFVNWENNSPCFTLTSACVGFNINLQRAIEYLKCNSEAKHIVVAHTEVMSGIMINEKSFVPHANFSDAAGAVILSKVESNKKEGVLHITNKEDMYMLDFLGANKDGDLFMNPGIVKFRATKNIVESSVQMLQKSGWNINDVDIVIPHQTGNAIVHGVAKKLQVSKDKLYQEVQINYGNLSGASIPFSLSLLQNEDRLKIGNKILTATAGLGGEYGAFTYIIPEIKEIKDKEVPNIFANKTILITGATSGIGEEISKQFIGTGAELILHYNSNKEKALKLRNDLLNLSVKCKIYKSDFNNIEDVKNLASEIKSEYAKIDYMINTVGITGGLHKAEDVSFEHHNTVMQINQFSPIQFIKALFPIIKNTILYIGSAAEDFQFAGSSSYVSSKQGLHGFAASFSYEAISKQVKSIYYMLGVVNTGMAKQLNEKQVSQAMMAIGQKETKEAKDVANRIVKSLYIPKQLKVSICHENALVVLKEY